MIKLVGLKVVIFRSTKKNFRKAQNLNRFCSYLIFIAAKFQEVSKIQHFQFPFLNYEVLIFIIVSSFQEEQEKNIFEYGFSGF